MQRCIHGVLWTHAIFTWRKRLNNCADGQRLISGGAVCWVVVGTLSRMDTDRQRERERVRDAVYFIARCSTLSCDSDCADDRVRVALAGSPLQPFNFTCMLHPQADRQPPYRLCGRIYCHCRTGITSPLPRFLHFSSSFSLFAPLGSLFFAPVFRLQLKIWKVRVGSGFVELRYECDDWNSSVKVWFIYFFPSLCLLHYLNYNPG